MAGPSRAKTRIAAGQPVISVNPGGVAIDLAGVLAQMGADVLFIDCERTAIGIESVGPMARAAQVHGTAAVARCHTADPADMVRILDRGVDGIVVPKVESAAQARLIVETVQYVCGARTSEKIVIAQIESATGVERVAEIASVAGIDLFLIGPYDLSHSMGYGGDITQPEVVAAVDRVVGFMNSSGLAFGLPVRRENARQWVDRGAVFLYHTAEWLLRPAFDALSAEVSRR
jgi:4-hydroxy-2-oxoheptanedioate aldolase